MVKQATTTVGTCCYIGCTKSFLTDKETPFFKFPDDLERRKKWISNCGNSELGSLAERQLRGKRICIKHFPASAFTGASGERNSLKDTAVPVAYKNPTPTPATPTASTKSVTVTPSPKPEEAGSGSAPPTVKRGRGRPPKIKQEVIIKCEPEEEEENEEETLAIRTAKEKSVVAPVTAPVTAAVTVKEKTIVTATTDVLKPVGTPGVTKEKSVVTPSPNKDKPSVVSGTVAEKSGELGLAKKKPVPTPGKVKVKTILTPNAVKGKPVVPPVTPKEKIVVAPSPAKEKSSNSDGWKPFAPEVAAKEIKEKLMAAAVGVAKEKPVIAAGTPKEKPAVTALKEKVIATPGTSKEKLSTVSALGSTKEKPVATPGATVEKPVSTPGAAKDKSWATLGTTKEKLVSTSGTAKEKPVSTSGTAKEKPVSTSGSAKEKPVSTSGSAKEKPVSTSGTKEKPVSTSGTAKEKPINTSGTAKEKPGSAPAGITKEKPVAAPTASMKDNKSSDSTKKKSAAAQVTGKGKATAQAKGKAVPSVTTKEKSVNANATSEEKTVAAADKGEEKPVLVLGPVKVKSGVESVKLLKDTVSSAPKTRKRKKMTKTEKDLKTKLRRIAVDIIQPNSEVMDVDLSSSSSCEDMDEDASHFLGSSDEEEPKVNVADNREFERFHKTLKANCVLPESWNFGAVLWDPNRKMKVIPASEVDISSTGTVRLKRSVQIFESMQTKVTVDGFDLTNRYDVKTVSGHQDVTRLILRVARSKICCGIKSISAEDAMYFPDAVPRGTTFYSEACPVIISKQSMGPLCNSCHKLRNAIRRRKSEQKRAVEMRKAKRSSLHTVNSPFGKALYTLLSDLMADENDPKKKKKRSTLYSRGHNVCLKDKDGETADKNASERATNSASISYIMQDIVSKMSLGKMPQEQQPQFFKSEEDQQMGMQILNGTIDSNSGNLVVQNAADFTLAEGQEYELIGEVDPNDVQVVEMIKERPNSPQIEIIEVDDHILTQLAAQNMAGMFLQDSGQIHVNMAEVDVNNPAMGQLLKVIGPSHGY